MRLRVPLLLGAILAPGSSSAQTLAPVDSMMTVRGIVELRSDQSDATDKWVVFLPAPVKLRSFATNIVTLAQGKQLAGRFVDRYVEVRSRVAVERDGAGRTVAIAREGRIREVRPDGLVRRDVDLSVSQHATVELAILPRVTVWRDSTGARSGMTPLVLFSIVNHSQTELVLFFPTNEVVCVRVRPADGAGARVFTWKTAGREQRVELRMGAVFRQILPIPDTVAAFPGRYTARVSLCGADEYHAEASFDILAP